MSELANGVPSGGEGTVAISDDGDDTVLGPEVGVWFLDDDPEWATFQCDGCGELSMFKRWQLPLELTDPCESCGARPTHLLAIVEAGGQVRLPTTAEVKALVA